MRVKRQMPGAGPGGDAGAGRFIRDDRALGGVETKSMDLIGPKVADIGMEARGIQVNAVRMRFHLPVLVHAGPLKCFESRRPPEAAVFVNFEDRGGRRIVIRNQRAPSALIDEDMAGARSARGYLIQRSQPPIGADREGADGPLRVLIDRIQKMASGANGEKTGIGRFRGEFALADRPGGRVEMEVIDAPAAEKVGVGADIHFLSRRRPGSGKKGNEQEQALRQAEGILQGKRAETAGEETHSRRI